MDLPHRGSRRRRLDHSRCRAAGGGVDPGNWNIPSQSPVPRVGYAGPRHELRRAGGCGRPVAVPPEDRHHQQRFERDQHGLPPDDRLQRIHGEGEHRGASEPSHRARSTDDYRHHRHDLHDPEAATVDDDMRGCPRRTHAVGAGLRRLVGLQRSRGANLQSVPPNRYGCD